MLLPLCVLESNGRLLVYFLTFLQPSSDLAFQRVRERGKAVKLHQSASTAMRYTVYLTCASFVALCMCALVCMNQEAAVYGCRSVDDRGSREMIVLQMCRSSLVHKGRSNTTTADASGTHTPRRSPPSTLRRVFSGDIWGDGEDRQAGRVIGMFSKAALHMLACRMSVYLCITVMPLKDAGVFKQNTSDMITHMVRSTPSSFPNRYSRLLKWQHGLTKRKISHCWL
ncbi:hypothetical protein AOLI_G00086860 [Acnodon oligacanthus]